MHAMIPRTAQPLAMTTPFVPVKSCADQFITTTINTAAINLANATVTVFASGPADARFAKCQPSGWDRKDLTLDFSPAVCPSRWTAYNMNVFGGMGPSANLTSTAYCCSSGFTYSEMTEWDQVSIEGMETNLCLQNVTAPETTVTVTTTTTPGEDAYVRETIYPYGVKIHDPWHIAWQSSDISTLSPPPPQQKTYSDCHMGFGMATWVPGEEADPSEWCTEGEGDARSSWKYLPLVIVLPIVAGIAIIVWIYRACAHQRRQRDEDERRQAEMQRQPEIAEVERLENDQFDEQPPTYEDPPPKYPGLANHVT